MRCHFDSSDSHSILLCPGPACSLLPSAPPIPAGACLLLRAQPSSLRATPALCAPTPAGALHGPHSHHLRSSPRHHASSPPGSPGHHTPAPLLSCPRTSGPTSSLDAVTLPEHNIVLEGVAHIHVDKFDVQRVEPGLLFHSLWVEPGVGGWQSQRPGTLTSRAGTASST